MAIQTINGAESTDATTLLGTDAADTIAVSQENNVVVIGKAAGDEFTFAAAAETATVKGGTGDDTVDFDKSVTSSFINGNAGADSINFESTITSTTLFGGIDDDNFVLTAKSPRQ